MGAYASMAEYYDLLYTSLKDYEDEASKIDAILRRHGAPVRRVLDVGCGTGLHALSLRNLGYEVDGLDLEPALVRIAAERNPQGRFWQADMAEFRTERAFDAVLCLFSAIGHVTDVEALRRTLRCFARALTPAGIAVVEPWFEPGVLADAHVGMHTAESDDVKLCRMSRTSIRGNVSTLTFDFLVATPESTRHFTDRHDLGLFSVEQMRGALEEAGFDVEHDPQGLIGRGLYVGRRTAGPVQPSGGRASSDSVEHRIDFG